MLKNKAFIYLISIATAGILVTFLSIYVETRSLSAYEQIQPYTKLAEMVQSSVVDAKNGLARLVDGSTGNYEDQVVKPMEESKVLLRAAFEEKSSDVGNFRLSGDEQVKVWLRSGELELDSWLAEVDKINQLKQSGSNEGVVEISARAMNAADRTQQIMAELGEFFTEKLESEKKFLSYLFWGSSITMAGVFGWAAFFIFYLQRKNENLITETQEQLSNEESRLLQLTGFIESVSNGNYNVDLESQGKEDHITSTLVRMRSKLKENAELETRRNWSTSGLAQIGEILRDSGSSADLYDNIIKFIVKYTRSNQGGLFILNDDDTNDPFLELAACYAFERKKFLTKRVAIGDGVVGQCFLEQEKNHFEEIPENYVSITSGLGGATPRSLVVVPLKVNDGIYGVIELASFNKYEAHEVELVEKFAESIAATVSSVKVNHRTRDLLEQTQQQAEEMRAQEEEMRQNMEELSATQEELQRQMRESEDMKLQLIHREKVFSLTTILSESDRYGTITYVNDKLCNVSKYTKEELIGKAHNIFRHPDMPKELFKLLWKTIQSGEVFQGVVKNRAKDGTHYWVDATIMPIKNADGGIVKYIGARYHIINDEMAEQLYNKQAEKLGLPMLQPA